MRCSSGVAVAVAALAAVLAPGAGLAEPSTSAAPTATPAAPASSAAALATPPASTPTPTPAAAVAPVATPTAAPTAAPPSAAPTSPADAIVPSGVALEPAAATSSAAAAPASSVSAAPDPAAAGSTAVATPAGPTNAAAPDPAAAGSTAGAAPALAVPATTFPAVLDASGAVPPSGPGPVATTSATASATATPAPRKPWRTLPLIGLALTGGFPDLATLNLLVRPVDWVRLYAGPSWGYLSWGMQGGVVLSPINWYVTPTLSFQAGKLFRSNASRFLKDDADTAGMKPLLQRIDYHYYAGDLGLELGSPRGFNFFLRFGLSFVVVTANGTGTNSADDGTRVWISSPRVSAWLPSAKLGFQYWF